jgi:formylglycine-generating enzyme required for sulfatase activity
MPRLHLLRGCLLGLTVTVALLTLRPGLAQPTKGKKHALLVGVDVYAHGGIRRLRGAENDVEELAKVLRKEGFAVRLLTTARGRKNAGDAPTAANVRKELDALLSDRTSDETVLIALTGHGAEVEVPHPGDAEKEKKRTRSYTYFLPADANLEKISYSTGHSDRLIELGALFDRLGKCGAGAKLMLIDACRDGVTAKSSTRAGALSPTHVTVPYGVNALFSCGPEEAALEMPFFPEDADDYRFHGVFFWHVIEGLKGAAANRRGSVNWSDLTSYVQDEVPAFVRRKAKELRKELPPQNPHAILNSKRPVLLVASVSRAVVSSVGMRLVRIPKGSFTMGSTDEERKEVLRLIEQKETPGWLQAEGPQHEVEITRDFNLGEKEVTQKQFKEVMGYNPSFFSADGHPGPGLEYNYGKPAGGKDQVTGSTDDYPVENVSWDEAMAFCRKLTEKDRAAGVIGRGLEYRLPTEAEWECACRAGSRTYQTFHFGNSLSSTQANFNSNHPYGGAAKGLYLARPREVGSYKPNAWGLYDMHGNVLEWCLDWYGKDYYAKGSPRDPAGPSRGVTCVVRGGSWGVHAHNCRSSRRWWFVPDARDPHTGFRVALVPSGEVVSSIGMRLVKIPRGTFAMGSTADERKEVLRLIDEGETPEWLRAEGPQHEVEITRDFNLGEKEVTQKQFKEVMGYNPSYFSKDGAGGPGLKYGDDHKPAGGKDKVKDVGSTDDFPVENVSWDEAVEFCRRLTERDRKEGKIGRGQEYRLPTEAQWEYACRGGARAYQMFHFGNSLSSTQANFNGEYPYGGAAKGPYLARTCDVGGYEKNTWGLCDMYGNVCEWCLDCWYDDYYAKSPRRDPPGPSTGTWRVIRGGDWGCSGSTCRSARRLGYKPEARHFGIGFRVALVSSGE